MGELFFFEIGALFCHCDEQAHHNSEQGNTFHEGGGQNHVGTDVARNFRLTGEGLESALANFTDTDTSANGSKACADTCPQFANTGTWGDVQ